MGRKKYAMLSTATMFHTNQLLTKGKITSEDTTLSKYTMLKCQKLYKVLRGGLALGRARQWVKENARARFGKSEKWEAVVNGNRSFAEHEAERPSWAPGEQPLLPSSLEALDGPWRLPRWPDRGRIVKEMKGNWASWTANAKLPKGLVTLLLVVAS